MFISNSACPGSRFELSLQQGELEPATSANNINLPVLHYRNLLFYFGLLVGEGGQRGAEQNLNLFKSSRQSIALCPIFATPLDWWNVHETYENY